MCMYENSYWIWVIIGFYKNTDRAVIIRHQSNEPRKHCSHQSQGANKEKMRKGQEEQWDTKILHIRGQTHINEKKLTNNVTIA